MDAVPEWFKGSRLNFAENLLWCKSKEKVAIVSTGRLERGEVYNCEKEMNNNAVLEARDMEDDPSPMPSCMI